MPRHSTPRPLGRWPILSFRADEELRQRLDSLAARDHITLGATVKRLLAAALRHDEQVERGIARAAK